MCSRHLSHAGPTSSEAQGELSALERGMHALNSQMDTKAYAASVGRAEHYNAVYNEVCAARVASVCHVTNDLAKRFSQLVEIHAAPDWLCGRRWSTRSSVGRARLFTQKYQRLVSREPWCMCTTRSLRSLAAACA